MECDACVLGVCEDGVCSGELKLTVYSIYALQTHTYKQERTLKNITERLNYDYVYVVDPKTKRVVCLLAINYLGKLDFGVRISAALFNLSCVRNMTANII